VTVHRVALRAGVVTAMAAALLAGFLTAPAHAQPQLRLGQIGNVDLRVGGGSQVVTIQVQNASNDPVNGTARNVQLTMTVPLAEFGVHIASAADGCNLTSDNTRMDCNLGDIAPGDARNLVTQVGVQPNSTLQSGETRNGNGQVALGGGGQTTFNVRLQGPDRPQPVANIAGIVTDELTGEGIEGADVFLTDSQGAEFEADTNSDGQFSFQGQDIAAGTIGIQASADGYESFSITEDVGPGESLTDLQLALVSTTPPTSAPPPTTEAPATTGAPTVAAAAEETSSGGGTFTTIMIILGVLFVLLGIGAIVFLIIRRRREKGEDDGPAGADGPFGPRGPAPTPGSHGVYRPTPTQVMGPRGPLPAVGPQPALANAPTVMHQRAGADETALLPRAGDAPTAPISPVRPAGPRPPVAGNPPPPRPAAPTYGTPAPATQAFHSPGGRHAGSPPAPYDDTTQARQPYGGQYGSPGGRHERGGYGSSYDNGSYGPDPYTKPQSPYERGDYRDGGGYDRPADHHAGNDYRAGGYGGAGSSGYGQSGYDDRSGYGGQHGGYDRGGYGGQDYGQPGYDQQRYDQPTQQRGHGNDYPDDATAPRSRHAAADPPERRRLDWLDQ
jgi:Carboxypeptidase regulatory-like domain